MSGYTITQVAEQLGIKVHTIRYWEKHVPLLSVQRDEFGKRIYNRHDIYVLIRLRHYIEEKQFTLQGASNQLIKELAEGENNDYRTKVLEMIKQLEKQRTRLQEAKELLQQNRNEELSGQGDSDV